MPGMNGREVLERIAQYDQSVADRIIIMTGDTADPETALFLSSLRNSVINKPFTLHDLRRHLSRVFKFS